MSKKPRAAAATAAAAVAASSADERDEYMRRVEIVGSLLDLNGEAREIDAPRLCRWARCLSVAPQVRRSCRPGRHGLRAAAGHALSPISLRNGQRGERDVALCRAVPAAPLLSVCLSAVCLSAVCVPPACWLTAQQSRCATHRSAAHEGCNKNRTQRAQPFRHRPAAAPDRAGRVMACAPLGCPR